MTTNGDRYRIAGTVLCLGVAVIHVLEQGGLTMRRPTYVGIGFYVLEVVSVIAAVLVLRRVRFAWLLAAGVALGPLAGYVLSRGPGLPDYTEDVGNWMEGLGIISMIVEGALLLISVSVMTRGFRTRHHPEPVPTLSPGT